MNSSIRCKQPLRVIIFGSWSNDWMAALGPSSKIWLKHSNVIEVLMTDDTNFDRLPPPLVKDAITICIPIMEWHMIEYCGPFPALVPNANTIRAMALKDRFYVHMEKIGLLHFCPRQYLETPSIQYPAVLKRTDRNGGLGVQMIHSIDELHFYRQQETWKDHPVILQEYISGNQEFVTHLVCNDGGIFWHSSFAYTHTNTASLKSHGTLIAIERMQISGEIFNIFAEIIRSLHFTGPCSIDYQFDQVGNLKIFEINPRFGGSLMRPENADLLRAAIDHIFALIIQKASRNTHSLNQ